MLFVDLDNFKKVNDLHGHHRGDELLIEIAGFLHLHTRPGDAVARYGGDEFTLWFDGIDEETALKRAESIVAESRQFSAHSGDADHPLGISVGIAMFDPASGQDVVQILRRADHAMYEVKRSGKSGFAKAAD